MMTDIGKLGLVIDTNSSARATEEFDRMADAAKRCTAAIEELKAALADMGNIAELDYRAVGDAVHVTVIPQKR